MRGARWISGRTTPTCAAASTWIAASWSRRGSCSSKAGRIAPDWAPPYVGLANYYTALPFYTNVSPAEVLPKARAALVQALELDETLAEAHAANAYIRAYYEWDWRAAEQEFRRALELRPNYADAYFSYSRFLASRRRLDEAIAQLGRAVELDPLSLPLQANRALLDYFAGRYDEADSRLREVLKSDSSDVLAKWGLALVAEQQGKPDEAIAILEPISGSSIIRKSSLGHAYAVAGNTARARKHPRRRCARRRPEATCPPTGSRWCTPVSASASSGAPLSRARVRGALDRAGLPADRSAARAAAEGLTVSCTGTTARRGVGTPRFERLVKGSLKEDVGFAADFARYWIGDPNSSLSSFWRSLCGSPSPNSREPSRHSQSCSSAPQVSPQRRIPM